MSGNGGIFYVTNVRAYLLEGVEWESTEKVNMGPERSTRVTFVRTDGEKLRNKET